jgi:hypothetical protein
MSDEEAFVRAFIVAPKRDRYLQLLASPNRRRDFLDRLNHQLDYDAAFAAPIPADQQSASGIALLLTQRGAPATCHLISSDSALDHRDLPLSEALDQVVGFGFGTVVSCIPGRLAYYEAEDAGERYILSR